MAISAIQGIKLLVELDPSKVFIETDHVHGPLLLKRQSFPGRVVKVLSFEEDYNVAIVETDDWMPVQTFLEFYGVTGVEVDQPVATTNQFIFAKQCQYKAPWHLARLYQSNWTSATNKTIFGSESDFKFKDIDVFVVDSGIDARHTDFEAGQIQNFYRNADSASGHGTHVAGLIGSQTHGVAKGVTIFNVHVLDRDGNGAWSSILDGLSEISRKRDQNHQCIINMSISGGYSSIVTRAIDGIIRGGCHVVVAAGNNNADACYSSPASSSAMTVGASTFKDDLASFSNYGTCVDIVAPGDMIVSTWPSNRTAVMSGTSQAAPLVAGIIAVTLTKEPWLHPYSMQRHLASEALKNVIAGVPSIQPNLLAHYPYPATC
jgi:subtilisin family serine protease